MRNTRRVGAWLALAMAVPLSTDALAQATDDNPPLPNVLLLVDTSGSMEYNIDGDTPATAAAGFNNCAAVGNTYTSRWHTLVQTLTGTVQNRGCFAHDRQDAVFISEFSIPDAPTDARPYDEGYFLDFHRLTSDSCIYSSGLPLGGPPPAGYNGYVDGDMMGWTDTPTRLRDISGFAAACSSGFNQTADGIIDIYRDRVRFGLFTFDAKPDPGTGATSNGDNIVPQTGVDGHFSYFEDWWQASGGSPATGNPNECDPGMVGLPFEVGARNPSAPPWEGKMINHGPVFATLQETRDHNARVEEVLLSLRPYGATPIAGMMDDARHFIREDDMMDGYYNIAHAFDEDENFAPAYDPLLNTDQTVDGSAGSCRAQYIILLSDGEPNLDMRPDCVPLGGETIPGQCPYPDEPYQVADDLLNKTTLNAMTGSVAGTPPVQTFVIGFGLGDPTGLDCETIDYATAEDPGEPCEPGVMNPLLAPCCELAKIAYYGGTGNAYFADDPTTLKAALATILNSIITAPTSRTVPSFINVDSAVPVAAGAEAVSFEFASAFTPEPGELWKGNLERKRWVCPTMGPPAPYLDTVTQSVGDDFDYNLNNTTTGGVGTRKFLTAIPPVNTVAMPNESQPTWTVRLNAQIDGTPDGLGTYGNTGVAGDTVPMEDIAAFPASVAALAEFPQAMGVDVADPPVDACNGPFLSIGNGPNCATAMMEWYLGKTGIFNQDVDGDGTIDQPDRSENMLGAVYHSSPRVVGPPSALTADPSYATFQRNDACDGACADNPATCDFANCSATGVFLEGKRPVVMYVSTTDGQLHAFKVAAGDAGDPFKVDDDRANELWTFIPPYVLPQIHGMFPATPTVALDGKIVIRDIPFERSLTDARAAATQYRTILVASGGVGGGYYFALDITRPEYPRFLWQLSTNDAGQKLFGDAAGEPAIALVPIEEGMPAETKEVAVAILPGGSGTPSTANAPPGCARTTAADHIDTARASTPDYPPRGFIRCFDDDPANSVTIVRLETGEIIRHYRRNSNAASGPTNIPASKLTDNAPVDEPILGAIAYPNGTGQVSTRAYLTGQDGSLYRIGFTSTDPQQWTFELMFDAYPLGIDNNTNAHPISVLPAVSTDEVGNPVLVFSTGDQETFRSTTDKYRVWSITEYPTINVMATTRKFEVESNWFLTDNIDTPSTPGFLNDDEYGMGPGEKVTGPIAIFGGVAYFTTNQPPLSGSECLVGTSRVWGVKYIDEDLDDKIPEPGFGSNYKLTLPDGENPFGVAVTAEPSCRTIDDNITNTFVGAHYTASQTARPNYVIRLFTGRDGDGVDDDPNSAVDARTIDVPEPPTTVTVDSWAAIVE